VISASAASTSDGDPQNERLTSSDGRKGGPERYRAGGEFGAVWRSVPGAGMPPEVRPSLRHLSTLHDASRGGGGAGSIVGALEAQGLHPPEQINLCRLHGRSAERSAGHCDQVARRARVPRGRDHRSAGAASPTADAAKRRSAAAAMQPQNSFLCAGRAIYSFSPRAATKQL